MAGYRERYLFTLIEALRNLPEMLALWEAGSAATGTTDQYSDIDLMIVCSCGTDAAFELIEAVLPPITHRHVQLKGHELMRRIYFHDEAPKHFYADIGVLREDSRETLKDLMQVERHGQPLVHFDEKGILRPQSVDKTEWRQRLESRVRELEEALPVYIIQVLKALDRKLYTEAFAFFYHGLLRRLVELMGIRFRPYRYDFELRYLERDFPLQEQELIRTYTIYAGPKDLRKKVDSVSEDIARYIAAIDADGILLT